MKKTIFYPLAVIFLVVQGCWYGLTDDLPPPGQLSNYEPVIVSRTDFESATTLEEPEAIINSGKIYIKDNFLFINEKNKGFHIFNNIDPENPVKIAFIRALGATDMAIKNDMIYINNATDLIAVSPDFNALTIDITKRIENTFPQMISPDGFYFYDLKEDEIIVDWILKN